MIMIDFYKKLTRACAALVLTVPLVPGCDGEGSKDVCDPGATQTCLCAGGVQGVQICSGDGSRWGDCDCSVPDADVDTDADADLTGEPDVDADVDAADDAGCEASCGPADTTRCSGQDLERCQAGTDGCLDWAVVQHCPDTGLLCMEVDGTWGCNEAPGNCSLDGAPCALDADCPETTVEGFCIFDGYNHSCAYDSRVETPESATCSGHPVRVCRSLFDCPENSPMMVCAAPDSSSCGAEISGLCFESAGAGSCPADITCELTGAQTCVICGNDEIDSTQEECDDGNAADGDGCSSQCQYERHCVNQYGETECGCITLEDCSSCAECGGEWLVCNECS
jgi:cysteine-rich repeat protein